MGGRAHWRHCFLPKSPEHSTPFLASSKTPRAGRVLLSWPSPSVPLSFVPVSFPTSGCLPGTRDSLPLLGCAFPDCPSLTLLATSAPHHTRAVTCPWAAFSNMTHGKGREWELPRGHRSCPLRLHQRDPSPGAPAPPPGGGPRTRCPHRGAGPLQHRPPTKMPRCGRIGCLLPGRAGVANEA